MLSLFWKEVNNLISINDLINIIFNCIFHLLMFSSIIHHQYSLIRIQFDSKKDI